MSKGKNLKPFKPGQTGNPGGRPKTPADLLKARSMNRVECQRILNKLIYMDDDEFNDFMSHPSTSKFDRVIGRLIMEAEKYGDPGRINFLLDRLIGKVKDDIEVTHLRRVVKKLDGTIVEYTNAPDEDEE